MTSPLYPSEAEIAVMVMGPKRAKEWPSKARFLTDKEGLPPIDPFMGGRYWPAVEEYFRIRNGQHSADRLDRSPPLAPTSTGDIVYVPFKPDGKDHFDVEEPLAFEGGRDGDRNRRARLPRNRSR